MQKFDLSSQAYKRNPYPTLARMVEQGPLVRARFPLFGKFWMATTYEAVSDLLRDPLLYEPESAHVQTKGAVLYTASRQGARTVRDRAHQVSTDGESWHPASVLEELFSLPGEAAKSRVDDRASSAWNRLASIPVADREAGVPAAEPFSSLLATVGRPSAFLGASQPSTTRRSAGVRSLAAVLEAINRQSDNAV